MIPQNVLSVHDTSYCPDGSSDEIKDYVDRVFSNVAGEVAKSREPVDWLVIRSNNLFDVCFSSQNHFEERLEGALKLAVKNGAVEGRCAEVIKFGSTSHGGAISEKTLKEDVRENMGEEPVLNYLNPLDMGTSAVVYRLDMREPSEKFAPHPADMIPGSSIVPDKKR